MTHRAYAPRKDYCPGSPDWEIRIVTGAYTIDSSSAACSARLLRLQVLQVPLEHREGSASLNIVLQYDVEGRPADDRIKQCANKAASSGTTARLLVEVKKLHNRKFWNGLRDQFTR